MTEALSPTLSTLQDVASLLAAVALLYHILALWEAWKFARQDPPPAPEALPPVSVLKPLAFWDPATRDNLRSFCQQDYPRFQVVLGPRPEDAAALRLAPPCQGDERREVTMVVCDQERAVNPKISQVLEMWPHARHDFLVLADQDMRVGPNYLRRVVAPLLDRRVGVVTCFHIAREAPTRAALMEARLVNTEYLPSILVGRRLLGMRFAFGATIATRREVLEAIGGFEALADYLADDYQIAYRAWRKGYRVVLSDYLVESRLPPMTWRQVLLHQLRWARTNRACQPVGWFFSVITHLTLWAVLWWALGGFTAAGTRVLLMTFAFRGLETTYYNLVFGGLRPAWRGAWMVPLQDLLFSLLWLLSLRTDVVLWRERRYRVCPDGTMRPVLPEGVAPEQL